MKTNRKVIVHPSYRAFEALAASVPDRFDSEGETLHAGRNTVKRFRTTQADWVVKRYKTPNLAQRIAYSFFKKSKAERAYLYAARMQERGIDTPTGIAYIEEKRGGLLRDSYFISTVCHDKPLYPVLVETPDYDRTLARQVAAFVAMMHQRGVLHGDTNLNNILYHTDADGQARFTVIDTNRSHFYNTPSQSACLHNLKRLTHRRDLLQYIIEEYATLRGWEPATCVSVVMRALEKFEKRRALRRRLLKWRY